MPEEKLEGVVEPLSEEVPATEEEQERETEQPPAPEGTPAEAEPAEEVDELTALQQELEEQKAKAAEYLDEIGRAHV